jgi:predicted DNA-binding transcriptional regulator AlpA
MTANPFESIENRLSNIESLLINLNQQPATPTQPDPDRWMNLQELCEYLPDHPKPQTVYSWVSNKVIPVNKGSKHLRFLKSEIDLWLKSGRRKTFAEMQAETSNRSK